MSSCCISHPHIALYDALTSTVAEMDVFMEAPGDLVASHHWMNHEKLREDNTLLIPKGKFINSLHIIAHTLLLQHLLYAFKNMYMSKHKMLWSVDKATC